jgi:hypothetical protein
MVKYFRNTSIKIGILKEKIKLELGHNQGPSYKKKKKHDCGGPPIALGAPKLEGPVGFFPPRYMASSPLATTLN